MCTVGGIAIIYVCNSPTAIVMFRYSVAEIPSASVKANYPKVNETMRASRDICGLPPPDDNEDGT
jgi:hypothetical protein